MLETMSGRFWANRSESPCHFKDPAAEEALWRVCETMADRS
jgi:hypothetical protein